VPRKREAVGGKPVSRRVGRAEPSCWREKGQRSGGGGLSGGELAVRGSTSVWRSEANVSSQDAFPSAKEGVEG